MFSLHAQTHIPNASFHGNYKVFSKSLNSLQTPNSLSLQFKPNIPSKPYTLCTHFPDSLISGFSNCSCSLSPQKNFHQILTEKVASFLIGSVIFIGFLNVGAAIALPSPVSSSVKLLEDRDTQEGKSEGEELYEKVLEKEPGKVEALKVVLYGKMRRGKTKEAIKYVEKLIDIEPKEIEWRLLHALCYEIMGQLSTAKRLFKEILDERPLLVRALHV